jgi:hypothetical protein
VGKKIIRNCKHQTNEIVLLNLSIETEGVITTYQIKISFFQFFILRGRGKRCVLDEGFDVDFESRDRVGDMEVLQNGGVNDTNCPNLLAVQKEISTHAREVCLIWVRK